MKKTKFTAALMIIAAGSALITANTAGAEEIEASRHHPGHCPPPHEWREPPRRHRHMPPPCEFDRGPRHMGFYERPGRHIPPHKWRVGPHTPPPPPPPDRVLPPRW